MTTINPADCPHDKPYLGIYRGGWFTMQRIDPGDPNPWSIIHMIEDYPTWASDDQVSDLTPLIPACSPAPSADDTIDERRRDADNPVPTSKACVDGLVRAGVLPDDSPDYVTHLMPRIQLGDRRGLWLEVTT